MFPPVAAALGLVVQHRPSGVTGAVMEWRPSRVTLLDRNGRRHQFVNERGAFSVEGEACTLVAPGRPRTQRRVTSSGSIAVDGAVARVARGGRIWVEGTNDAELVEHVWGDDLRVEGVVVEPMGGMDDLEELVARFDPSPDRPLGVLLDHLVAGSKEQRAAERLAADPNVLITGHPFVDVWAAIDPSLAGLLAWPDVPRGVPWKDTVAGICGFDRNDRFWISLLRRVRTYADLDPTLVGAVERLIDFVTVPAGALDAPSAATGG